jgi:hypothetical protein
MGFIAVSLVVFAFFLELAWINKKLDVIIKNLEKKK